jgi:hypothetical protein
MWWVLIPAAAVLVSAVVALSCRGRVTAARFDRSANEPTGGPTTEPPPA